ncbi:DUF6318 family protein [Candidatus Blastococcus massiliensis]|uniref:DUF6318 family protein n=1 Tax=Candidatus Blastococcus massiliensis TaxID=1470358 RepID=UPI0004BA45A5|nr:DUF6318 family protein [Candidatus Blastococcus massiliensis]
MARRWIARLSIGLIAAVALTGCSDKQEASESLPSASSSAAPSEEELAPLGPEDMPMPDEARTQDAAGAEAFVRYYVGLINRTSTVMDAQPLREFSDGCRECDRMAKVVEDNAAAGHRFVGGEVAITHLAPIVVEAATAEFDMRGDLAAGSAVDASGAEIADLGSAAYSGLAGGAAVRWNPIRDMWVMTAFTLE